MPSVGLPRALLYYQYYPLWRTFFEALGAKVIVSAPTGRGMITAGGARVVSDTCLPVKVFIGHVLTLVNRCDYLFIPSIRSLEPGLSNCSKFLGLPDMVRAVVPDCPPILDPDVDLGNGRRDFSLAVYDLGRHFTLNPLRIRRASDAALQVHRQYRALMLNEGLTPPEAMERLFGPEAKGAAVYRSTPATRSDTTIAVIGHPYVIHDEYVNHRLVRRLRSMGVTIRTPEMARDEEQRTGVWKLMGSPYWTFENDVTGAGGHYLGSGVDGVIAVVAFGCGPDSVMVDVVNRHANSGRTPFMAISLDEHSGEAGLVTRLEAFTDMLRRRREAERQAALCG